jgi:hypothetical protein
MNNIYRTKGMKHIFPYIFDIDFVNGDFSFLYEWRKGRYCLIDGGKDYTVSLMEERTILSHWGKDYTVSWRKGLYCLIDGRKDYTVSWRKGLCCLIVGFSRNPLDVVLSYLFDVYFTCVVVPIWLPFYNIPTNWYFSVILDILYLISTFSLHTVLQLDHQ